MKVSTSERLRNCCDTIRPSSIPLSDLISLMQESADKLDKLGSALTLAYEALMKGEVITDTFAIQAIKEALESVDSKKDKKE